MERRDISRPERRTIETIRIEDRKARRYTGAGTSYSLGDKLLDFRDYGVLTFEVIYLRYQESDKSGRIVDHIRKYTPDGKVVEAVDDGRRRGIMESFWDLDRERGLAEDQIRDISIKIEPEFVKAEIVEVLPNPLTLYDSSDVADQFNLQLQRVEGN